VLLVGNPALPLKGFDVALAALSAVNRVLPLRVRHALCPAGAERAFSACTSECLPPVCWCRRCGADITATPNARSPIECKGLCSHGSYHLLHLAQPCC
jgi:hypothetical protein